MGSNARQTGKADLMTPEQKDFLTSLLTGIGPLAQQAYPGLLEGYSEETFQKGVVDPAMKTYSQQILPSIDQRFTDANAGSSSALNQALVQSSEDLSNVLAGQRINYQQMMSQQQLSALSQILSLLGQRSFDPIVQGPTRGLASDLISAGGQVGAAALMSSSIHVKENIRDYDKGLSEIEKMKVKQYDYTIPVEGSQTDRVGLIAEEMPKEIQAEVNGVRAVDLYGLVSILINAVKELNAKIKLLEAH